MSDPTNRDDETEAPQAAAAEDEAAPESETPDPADVIVAINEELNQTKDQLLRTAAEMENLRRRTEREVADAHKYAIAKFARDLLSVGDNLERALGAVSEEEKTAAEAVWKNLLEGVSMTERELLSALGKNGVARLDAEGEKFDPNRHQAMFEVPNADLPNGTVVQVVQPGYMLGERVLRPAMVGVSKGGPKAAPKTDEPAAPVDTPSGESIDKSV